MLARSLVSSNTFSLTRVGANVSGGAIAEDLYVNSREELDALLIANGVAEADVVSTWDAIWPVLIDPDTGVEYASAATADNQIYNQGGILKTDIVAAIPEPSPYEFTENFEGSESDSQSNSGYDLAGWTASSAYVNPNDASSPAPLEGSYSWSDGGNGVRYIERSVTAGSEYHIYFQHEPRSSTSTQQNAVVLLDSGNNTIGHLQHRGNRAEFYIAQGTVNNNGVNNNKWTDLTKFHIWIDWYAETGPGNLDGIIEVYGATTATKPASPSETITVGDADADIAKVRFYGQGASVIDTIIGSTTEIGSDPLA